jgi:AcrR family transcriptional regulator
MPGVTFQRARSDAQREQRRAAVLDAATEMLSRMPVADVTLNELSRRVGLAKSNVLRYFESREAVLLELLDRALREWAGSLPPLVAEVPRRGGPALRADRLAAVLAASLASRPVLCDLLAAQAAVLERNVSTSVAARYKRATLELLDELAAVVTDVVPELAPAAAQRFCAAMLLVTGASWTYSHPSAALVAAYEAEPELAVLRLEHEEVLRELFAVLLRGLLARGA